MTKWIAAIMIMAAFFALPSGASAEDEERQYKIEAAFLYNFFDYITWPGYASPQALKQSVICVYGDDPIVPYLVYIQSKKVDRQIVVYKLEPTDSTDHCHIVLCARDWPELTLQH